MKDKKIHYIEPHLRAAALSMAHLLFSTPEKVPVKLIEKYAEIRDRTFPLQPSGQPQIPPKSPIPCDQIVFARALKKCGMPLKRIQFTRKYPHIFNNK